jgi:molybdopterin synthase sulfur carrier subunit
MSPETITVKILFFGAAAEIAGQREAEITFASSTTAHEAFEKIQTVYQGLGRFGNGPKNSLLFAINQEYANGGEILNEGDELAIIPPVSGG